MYLFDICISFESIFDHSEEYEMDSVSLPSVSVDRDPFREQLLQSSEGQVQRGPVPGATGNHY